jgi:hypothetical protein
MQSGRRYVRVDIVKEGVVEPFLPCRTLAAVQFRDCLEQHRKAGFSRLEGQANVFDAHVMSSVEPWGGEEVRTYSMWSASSWPERKRFRSRASASSNFPAVASACSRCLLIASR